MSGERENQECGQQQRDRSRLPLAWGGEVVRWAGSRGKERMGQAARGLRRDGHRRLVMDHERESRWRTLPLPWSSPCSAPDDLSDSGSSTIHWDSRIFLTPLNVLLAMSLDPHNDTFAHLPCFPFTSVGLAANSWNVMLPWLQWEN